MSIQETAPNALVANSGHSQSNSPSKLNASIELPSRDFLVKIFAGDTPVVSIKAVLSMALVLAVLCAGWAIFLDVAYPIAVTAGFCALAAIACSYAALLVVLNITPGRQQAETKSTPSAAWQLVERFRISDASRLWCDIEPGCPASQESLAWTRAMLDAIKRGELPVSPNTGDNKFRERERLNPSWCTEIERGDLAAWAKAYGHTPQFLHR